MKIFGKKNLVDHLRFNSSLSDPSDEMDEFKLFVRVNEIFPGTYHAFGNILVYCYSNGDFEVIDDNLFRNIKEL